MPTFNVAWRTRVGVNPPHDAVRQIYMSAEPDAPRWVVLTRRFAETPLSLQPDFQAALLTSLEAVEAGVSRLSSLEVHWAIFLDPANLTLKSLVERGALHYFRLADAAIKPLPPNPGPIVFAAGDTYVALSPGVRRIAESAAIARFLHLRDDFNAEKLADALLDHLLEFAGTDELPEDISALVIEAR